MNDWPDWRDWRSFPKSRPRAAKGGIRAQTQRGSFGASWWAKRWISTLESFQLGSRLQRGRSYARAGQVLAIAVEAGAVSAQVQGSRPKPYQVRIEVRKLKDADWRKLAGAASAQAIFAAKLLGGEMPQDIETLFQKAGLSLFPGTLRDLATTCSCPDSSNPCKHIAAVYYLLGEEFDRDPFLIFQLRGITRERFLGLLGEAGASEPAAESAAAEERPKPAPEPLPVAAAAFWNGGEIPADLLGEAGQAAAGAALPRRLGPLPFWRGRDNFLERLESIYIAAAGAARALTER